ncbi:Flp pilus assembly protein CpaB [Pseudosulfitobacter sp. DSM 107133]|uniref:Flp pilus assembly protein CpaB n=1 Tax=Pseudosulfitobacter sp. DSM 107133 TaxID=2883100 RepID=UPI000DF14F15|nr:Flp pilus assembly protein CpaB [Pseudosulfitobacter sp. DSM 107133]UOA25415.1 hypothetical protein DSM107133_00087 [Pseudosulfitobacter sp. DSM 107133]
MEFSSRTILVIMTSLVLAGGVAWVGVQANSVPEPLPPSQPMIATVVPKEAYLFAGSTIDSGGQISSHELLSVEMNSGQAGENLIADTEENRMALIQLSARRMIPANTPFVSSDIQPVVYSIPEPEVPPVAETPTFAGIATLLRPGMRAIALPLTGETAAAGLIDLGDRIDVLLSYDDQSGVRAVRTVLQNVQVIATDQSNGSAGVTNTAAPRTITLELHPEGAKVLALARHTGDLVLVLSQKTDDDMPVIANDPPVLATQISGLPAPSAKPVAPSGVRVVRGSSSSRSQSILPQPVPAPDSAVASSPPDTTGSNP